MVLSPYPITGKVYASDGSTGFPDAKVVLRNTTRQSSMSQATESDGSFSFDLANFVGGYADGDSLKIEAKMGSFYQYTTATVDTGLPGIDTSLTMAAEACNDIVDTDRLKEEIIIFLRKRLTDPQSRGTDKTDVLSGTGSKVKFELSNTTAKYVEYVTVDGTMKSNYTDYYVHYNDDFSLSYPTVYFLTPPSDGAVVEIKHKYGQSWIYPDVPKVNMSLDNYPRVNVNFLATRTTEAGLGSDSNITDFLGQITVWSTKESELGSIVKEIRELIMQNKKNFHYFKLIIPQDTGPILVSPNRDERIVQQNQDFIIKFRVEII